MCKLLLQHYHYHHRHKNLHFQRLQNCTCFVCRPCCHFSQICILVQTFCLWCWWLWEKRNFQYSDNCSLPLPDSELCVNRDRCYLQHRVDPWKNSSLPLSNILGNHNSYQSNIKTLTKYYSPIHLISYLHATVRYFEETIIWSRLSFLVSKKSLRDAKIILSLASIIQNSYQI